MFRSTTSILALLAAMTVPAMAADYGDWGDEASDGPDFRTSYPVEPGDWAGLGDDDDPISLEFGIRYWYALGQQEFTSSGGNHYLSPADFQVSDNGTVRKLTSVRLVDSGAHLIALVFEPLPADGRRLARQAACVGQEVARACSRSARNRSASRAAAQPVPAAVTAWR